MPARVRAFLKAFSARFLMRFFLARRLAFFLAALFFLARRLAFFFAAFFFFRAFFLAAAFSLSETAVGVLVSSELAVLVLPSLGAEWAGTVSMPTVSAVATRAPQRNDKNCRMMKFLRHAPATDDLSDSDCRVRAIWGSPSPRAVPCGN